MKELKKRANDSGVTCVLIMIDGEGDMSAPDAEHRKKAVKNHEKWVDAAALLGCHAIRINTGRALQPHAASAPSPNRVACSPITA